MSGFRIDKAGHFLHKGAFSLAAGSAAFFIDILWETKILGRGC
jgi:hypothetical protein